MTNDRTKNKNNEEGTPDDVADDQKDAGGVEQRDTDMRTNNYPQGRVIVPWAILSDRVLWWFRKQRYYHRRQKREKNVIQEWNHPNKDDSDPDGDDDESCAQSIAFAQPTTSYSPRKYMYRTSKCEFFFNF
ncbi:hypothetical protein B9Z55_009527 [Caenorhabditis nigoni]|uniref:Uncharacterized protein n=1 Tax=Caenorhabditis nigoni TaxID=1611254 RepID=A0A2G5USG3_9PELO|nr:hypothetical protein B9Z55_009527 [Caenorhabditis nigoni]